MPIAVLASDLSLARPRGGAAGSPPTGRRDRSSLRLGVFLNPEPETRKGQKRDNPGNRVKYLIYCDILWFITLNLVQQDADIRVNLPFQAEHPRNRRNTPRRLALNFEIRVRQSVPREPAPRRGERARHAVPEAPHRQSQAHAPRRCGSEHRARKTAARNPVNSP